MSEYRYILEPYKGINTRYSCPICQQRDKTFTLYIDTETGKHLHPTVGRCNRENNCGYHYTPKQYFQDNNISFNKLKSYKPQPFTSQPKPISFISTNVFKASLKAYDTNHFVNYLIWLFGLEITNKLISKYYIGSSSFWQGATVFWQIDNNGKVRTGKIMLYDPITGKRVKTPYNHINWVHKLTNQAEFNLQQCFFGQHLVNENLLKPIAIVESEKTAIIASVYLNQYLWLATGSSNNLSIEKIVALEGRKVCLFPDANSFEKWNKKAKDFSNLIDVNVSTLLERKCTETEKLQGLDIADFLTKFNYKDF